MTLSTLFEAYLTEYLLERSPTSHPTWKSHARILVAELGDPHPESVHQRDLKFWIAQSRGRLQPATIGHRLSFLRCVYAWGIGEGLLDANLPNPTYGLRPPKINNARRRYLSHDEERALSRAMDAKSFSLVRFTVLTGLRRLELFHLRPEDLDFTREELFVRDSKTGTPRIVPCHPEALLAARYWLTKGGPFVFVPHLNPSRRWRAGGNWTNRVFVPALEGAQIPGFRFHDLRHTFASRLVERGVPLYTVQVLLGHKDPKQTQRYAHLSSEHLREAVYRLN